MQLKRYHEGVIREARLFLDNHPQVLWWYRNLVGAQHFAIQGYRRNRIYANFVVQQVLADYRI